MTLRPARGNMYDFVTHTYNAIKGRCPHDCIYCYMKIFPLGDLRLDDKALTLDLGTGNFIFVGSSCDMFADAIPEDWIIKTLNHCSQFSNKYLFQSKNPKRILALAKYLPKDVVIGTTIESNRHYVKIMGNAPNPSDRALHMGMLHVKGFKTMVTIEPILDFDVTELAGLIRSCSPDWVNIGADSKDHHMPEPSKEKILALIVKLYSITEIRKKTNLGRLMA
jgi:DNA repair photolyase